MFPDLIDNLGIRSTYDVAPVTNEILPASKSKWYMFAIPLFQHLNIPWNLINTGNSCKLFIKLASEKFIVPSSDGKYADLALYVNFLYLKTLFLQNIMLTI